MRVNICDSFVAEYQWACEDCNDPEICLNRSVRSYQLAYDCHMKVSSGSQRNCIVKRIGNAHNALALFYMNLAVTILNSGKGKSYNHCRQKLISTGHLDRKLRNSEIISVAVVIFFSFSLISLKMLFNIYLFIFCSRHSSGDAGLHRKESTELRIGAFIVQILMRHVERDFGWNKFCQVAAPERPSDSREF